MSEDYREQIDCRYITEDGRCVLYSEPDYIDWCVLGPCQGYERRAENDR